MLAIVPSVNHAAGYDGQGIRSADLRMHAGRSTGQSYRVVNKPEPSDRDIAAARAHGLKVIVGTINTGVAGAIN